MIGPEMEIEAVAEALETTGLLGAADAREAAHAAIAALDRYRSTLDGPLIHRSGWRNWACHEFPREARVPRGLPNAKAFKPGDTLEVDEGTGTAIYTSDLVIGLLLDNGRVCIIGRNK